MFLLQGIFDLLCGLDEGGLSCVLEVSRNATKLHNHFGTLLAHPFQRPMQKYLRYTLTPKDWQLNKESQSQNISKCDTLGTKEVQDLVSWFIVSLFIVTHIKEYLEKLQILVLNVI